MREKSFEFEPDAAVLAALRVGLGELLAAEGWAGADREAVLLAAHELAMNAVMHAQTSFVVRCRVGEEVEVTVVDGQPRRLPYVRPVGDGRPGGFGLRIVEQIAREWGVEQFTEAKAVRMVVGRYKAPVAAGRG